MTKPEAGHLAGLTRRLHITAYTAGGVAALSFLFALNPGGSGISGLLVLLFYLAMLTFVVAAIGAVVGRLLLAARMDEHPVTTSDQNWYE